MWTLRIIFFILMLFIFSFEDIRNRNIRLILLIIFAIANYALLFTQKDYIYYLITNILISLFFVLLSLATKQKIAVADSIIIGSVFLYYNLWNGLVIILLSFIILNFFAVVTCLFKKRKIKEVPYIPFLTSAVTFYSLAGVL